MYIKSQCIKIDFSHFTLVSANGVFTSMCQSLSQRSGKSWLKNVPMGEQVWWDVLDPEVGCPTKRRG